MVSIVLGLYFLTLFYKLNSLTGYNFIISNADDRVKHFNF